ncbi:MAG TPA: signal recognition particle receptor subunit alpha, partial [Stenomitos sp.]
MAFNWFRRQFTPSEDETNASAESEVQQNAESAPDTAEASAQGEEVQEDYLAWAKAAYQNIQQRQAQSSVALDDALPTPADPVLEDAAEPVASVPDQDDVVLAEATVEAPETPQPQESVETPEPETAEEPEALPLWAKADAERQARLERLSMGTTKTSAPETNAPEAASESSLPVSPKVSVELPQPSVDVQQPLTSTPTGSDAMDLDEGFLWSAEILAAQGRRPEEISAEEITWLQKLRTGLGKTRRGVVNQIKAIVGQGPLTANALMEIESLLLLADVGIEATDTIIEALQQKVRQETLPPDAAIAYLKQILREILDAPLSAGYSRTFAPEKDAFNIWLMTGVNGAGKTTTIGKIAHVAKESGFNCLVAAADTFRAAAVEQVKIWAQRSGVEVIANPGQNTDPAAVVFDAITAAQSRGTELLLVDTAGRLQNKKNLMDELRKVRQVIDRKAPQAKVESLLVLDATLGQNG